MTKQPIECKIRRQCDKKPTKMQLIHTCVRDKGRGKRVKKKWVKIRIQVGLCLGSTVYIRGGKVEHGTSLKSDMKIKVNKKSTDHVHFV